MPRVCLLLTKLSPVKVESKEHVEVYAIVSVKVCANVSVKVATLLPVGVMRNKKIVCQKILEGGKGCKL